MATNPPINVAVQRSGIASIVSLPNRADAQQLHDYLKAQGCSVGEIFVAGGFSFFAYSIKRPIRETISLHSGYRLVERRNDVL